MGQTIEVRKLGFIELLRPYLDIYGREMLNQFFDYWTEHNPNGKKMRFEMERVFCVKRRLKTWYINQQKYERKPTKQNNPLSDERILSAIHRGMQNQSVNEPNP